METAKRPDGVVLPSEKVGQPSEEPSNVISFLKAIEGGRAKDANTTLAEFAKQTQEMSVEIGELAGFAVLIWNDEGECLSTVYLGPRNPYSQMLIPGIASDMFKGDVIIE